MAQALGMTDATKPEDVITALTKLQEDCSVIDLKISGYGIGITPEDFLFQDSKDPRIITLIEGWVSQYALDMHMDSIHFKEIVPALSTFFEKPEEINVYQPVGEKKTTFCNDSQKSLGKNSTD